MIRIVLKESRLREIIKETINETLNQKNIKKGDKFNVVGNSPKILAKMIAKKYGVRPEDFNFDGISLIYNPKTGVTRKKISKPDDMPVDVYYAKYVLPNKPELGEEEKKYSDEEWKPIQNIGRYFKGAVDYSNAYEISNYGRLKIINLEDAIKSRIYTGYDASTRGSMQAHLNVRDENGELRQTTGFIGNMVADAFLEPHDPKKFMVKHKDGNYGNNHVSNLEWVPRTRNTKKI